MKFLLCLLFSIQPFVFSTVETKEYKILALDGGGVRGAASLEILKDLQKSTHAKFHRDFDLFAGTSTGSIIALFLSLGMDVDDILTKYEDLSGIVFKSGGYGFFGVKYKPATLKECIIDVLKTYQLTEESTLADLPKKIVIPTVALDNPQTGRPSLIFRENITQEGGKTKIIDAILESTAAPTYFPSHLGDIDGGVGMNDPSLAALLSLYDPQKSNLRDITLLSIGTGYDPLNLPKNENWGIVGWISNLFGTRGEDSSPIVSALFDVNEQIPSTVCKKLLGDSYMRVNFPLSKNYPLDDYKNLATLIQQTDTFFIHKDPEEWERVCVWITKRIKP